MQIDQCHIVDDYISNRYYFVYCFPCRADGFKVLFDWTRAALSPDGTYATAGSQDGRVYTWNVQSGALENALQEHE